MRGGGRGGRRARVSISMNIFIERTDERLGNLTLRRGRGERCSSPPRGQKKKEESKSKRENHAIYIQTHIHRANCLANPRYRCSSQGASTYAAKVNQSKRSKIKGETGEGE